jgi:cytochrome c
MPLNYEWDRLQRRGDWVFNEGAKVNKVARLAKLYVARNLPEGSQVVTLTTPDGTMTVLTYVPTVSRAKSRDPVDDAPEPRPKPLLPKVDPSEFERDPFEELDRADDNLIYGEDE